MTKIYAERDGDLYLISAQGHATGSVEVCAAISGILYALMGYVKNAADESAIICSDQIRSGDVQFQFRGGPGAAGAFEMAVIGLMQIEAKYPEFIQVEYREE